MTMPNENLTFNDEVKASVARSGALVTLKDVTHTGAAAAELEAIVQQAQSAVENLEQLLDNGKLDDTATQRVVSVLSRLKSVLTGDNVSPAAIASALSEATSAANGVNSSAGKAPAAPPTVEQLWAKVETYNKEIDDDFEKMRKAGVTFNDGLWNRHNDLIEHLKNHPRDINAQKELHAIDDALLLQAEAQLKDHPNAQAAFDDARKKSDERRELINSDLALVTNKKELLSSNKDADWETSVVSSEHSNISFADITSPIGGAKTKAPKQR
jgi:hypothetical protein